VKFLGQFKPPAVGKRVTPIEIAGPGSCTVTDEALQVDGFRSRSRARYVWLGFAALVIVTYFLRIRFDLPDAVFYAVLGSGVLLLFTLATRGKRRIAEGEGVSLSIPWSSVKRVSVDDDEPETVVIVLRKFERRGALYFAPHDGVDALLEALDEPRP
jgi:hypothetical protein